MFHICSTHILHIYFWYKIIYGTYINCIWDIYNLYREHIWNIYGTYMKCVSRAPRLGEPNSQSDKIGWSVPRSNITPLTQMTKTDTIPYAAYFSAAGAAANKKVASSLVILGFYKLRQDYRLNHDFSSDSALTMEGPTSEVEIYSGTISIHLQDQILFEVRSTLRVKKSKTIATWFCMLVSWTKQSWDFD